MRPGLNLLPGPKPVEIVGPALLSDCRAFENGPLTGVYDDVWNPANQFRLSRYRDTMESDMSNDKNGRSCSPG